MLKVFNHFFYFFVGRWGGGGSLPRFGGGALHSDPTYLLFGAIYWSIGRRGYLGISNVALVIISQVDNNTQTEIICNVVKSMTNLYLDRRCGLNLTSNIPSVRDVNVLDRIDPILKTKFFYVSPGESTCHNFVCRWAFIWNIHNFILAKKFSFVNKECSVISMQPHLFIGWSRGHKRDTTANVCIICTRSH